MTDIQKIVKNYIDANDKLNEEIRKNSDELVISIFTNIFEQFTDLNRVVILGWTPNFNDGEPCEHTSVIFTGRVEYRYKNNEYRDYEDFAELEEYFISSKNPNEECSDYELEEAYQEILKYQDIFDKIYGTNFMVIVDRKEDGTVEVTEEEFHCGY